MVDRLCGFQRLDNFVRDHMKIQISAENIFVKYLGPDVVPLAETDMHMSMDQVIDFVLNNRPKGRSNQLGRGYDTCKHEWYGLNTTLCTIKSKKWAEIHRKIGTGNLVFLLRETTIMEKVEHNYVIIGGDMDEFFIKKEGLLIKKKDLIKGRPASLLVSVEDAESVIFGSVRDLTPENRALMAQKVGRVVERYLKLPLRAIFKSYIIEKDWKIELDEELRNLDPESFMRKRISPEVVVNFLFAIAKKCMRPIFDMKTFRVLKGKLTLLLKRNIFEALTLADLSNRISTVGLKLFTGCKGLERGARMKIVRGLMGFLFTSIFTKLVEFFFYSTITSCSKRKIFYFTRVDWSKASGEFFKGYLKTFRRCFVTGCFATMRLIPKEKGFRPITNCSRITSYETRREQKLAGIYPHPELLPPPYRDMAEDLVQADLLNRPTRMKGGQKRPIINTQVSPIAPILKKMAAKVPGFSIHPFYNIGKKISDFLKPGSGRMLLMKVDLQKCFDNIPQDRLLEIIKDLLDNKDIYYSRELSAFRVSKYEGKIETKRPRDAPEVLYPMYLPEGQPEEYRTMGKTEPAILRETKISVLSKEAVFNQIRNTIKNTTILYQNKHYSSTVGIRQGCTISPYLCNIYFSGLDKEFAVSNNCLIVRYVDDYFVMTDDPEDIRIFMNTARQLRDRGFIINEDKVEANFDWESLNAPDGEIKFTSDHVKWCGIKIYDQGYAVKTDCKEPSFRHTVSLSASERGKRMFDNIKIRMNHKLGKTYINKRNRKLGECIFDMLFFSGRRLKVLMARMEFVNVAFLERILEWCESEVLRTLKARNICFDGAKLEKIARDAYERCGVRNIVRCRRRPFH